MQDDVSRLVGLEGFVVTAIEEIGARSICTSSCSSARRLPALQGVEVRGQAAPAGAGA